ncbi:MAG: phosphotransferase [Desulfobacteraceae bacterium]|nr:phosphotransferase [Desulfobacteraceae bacterium]
MLDTQNILHPNLLMTDESSNVCPYGFLIQSWTPGIDAFEHNNENLEPINWLEDIYELVKKAHQIKLPYWGSLANGLRFNSFQDYYSNILDVVSSSFGKILNDNYSLLNFEELGIVKKGSFKTIVSQIIDTADSIKSNFDSVLVHGDSIPTNSIYNMEQKSLIDWDESRAIWWVYDIARLSFYIDPNKTIPMFLSYYNSDASTNDIYSAIKLEHSRQLLRQIFLIGFRPISKNEASNQCNKLLNAIKDRLDPSSEIIPFDKI